MNIFPLHVARNRGRRLIGDGAYSSKYGIPNILVDALELSQILIILKIEKQTDLKGKK